MSLIILARTKMIELRYVTELSVGKSLYVIASTVMRPRPGIPKNDSKSREPITKNGKDRITRVRIGIMAFLRRCRVRMDISPRPLALAVRI